MHGPRMAGQSTFPLGKPASQMDGVPYPAGGIDESTYDPAPAAAAPPAARQTLAFFEPGHFHAALTLREPLTGTNPRIDENM